MRALVVTNMWPSPQRPALGSFVQTQVEALRATGEAEIDVHAFAPGSVAGYAREAGRLSRETRRGERYDVVHAHFGLTAGPALAARGRAHAVTLHGTDLHHPRSRAITLAALPFQELVAVVSDELARSVPRWATRNRAPAILPTGVDTARFTPADRTRARRHLNLDPDARYLLLPADPARPEKRADRASELAAATGATLLTLGATPPGEVAHWVNAANAVLVPSERESFGLAVLEALACEVPVLATPTGIAPQLLSDLPGALCAPYELNTWARAIAGAPPRLTGGRARAQAYGADVMARRVLAAWRALLS